MFGENVIVREFGGKPVVCKVWEVDRNRVYVCTEETFRKLKGLNGKPFPANCFPVAFPRKDVFRYNSRVDLKSPAIWDKLIAYEN